jgi:hypothetical protein
VERCSYIILHYCENHELLFSSFEILLDPKLSLGVVLFLLSIYVVVIDVASSSVSSLLLWKALFCSYPLR